MIIFVVLAACLFVFYGRPNRRADPAQNWQGGPLTTWGLTWGGGKFFIGVSKRGDHFMPKTEKWLFGGQQETSNQKVA